MSRVTRGAPTVIALCATLFVDAAGSQSREVDLIDLRKIPGASGLGWVEVERQIDDVGWHCDASSHLYLLSRLREGRARIPPRTSEAGFRAVLEHQARQGRLPEVDAGLWHMALGTYLRDRLTRYFERGKPGSSASPRSFSWRGWLRETLEKINAKADREGMSQQAKRQALRNWVLCHISEVEAEGLRQIMYDNGLGSGSGR